MPDPKPNPASRLPRHIPRTPGDYGRGHLKVDNLLRDEDRDAYHALLRQPGTTGRKAYEWLVARGYRVSTGAVKRHKQRFNQKLETIRTSAEWSLACADLVRQVGVNRMSDAAVLRFEALLTEELFKIEQGGDSRGKVEWDTLGRALTNAVANRTRVETTRIAAEEAKRQAERDARGTKPRRLDGPALSEKVRRILGVPLPGEPLPALPPPVPAEQRTSDSNTPSPPPSPGGRGSEGADNTARVEQPRPCLPLPPGVGGGEGT